MSKRYYKPDRKYSCVFNDKDLVALFAFPTLAITFVSRSGGNYIIRDMTLREVAGIDKAIILGEKLRDAVNLGARGGRIGGPSRAAKLSPERRREIAVTAAKARWEKQINNDYSQ